MVKRWIVVGVTLLACLLVVGCGVPQEDYDAVVADTEAAKTKVASLESELAATESDLAEAEDNLAAVQNELAAVQDDIGAAQDEVAAEESRASSAQSQVSSLRSRISSLESEIEAAEATIAELEAAIVAVEEAATAAAEEAAREAAPKLRLLWLVDEGGSGGGLSIYGRVENISGESLHDVEVVLFIRIVDSAGDTRSEKNTSALIDENPLLPGETSTFEVSITYLAFSGGQTKYMIYFRFLDGDEIPYVEE